jgi:hypothetical protein
MQKGENVSTRNEVRLIDDLDGSTAQHTLRFWFDDVPYVIDLSEANAARLRETIAPWIAAARVDASTQAPLSPRVRRAAELAKIREWATENGLQVNARGPIPRVVVIAYQAAIAGR